ncbi:MAG: hypothetical protein J6W36_04840 [Clostridiales bacterium]|nr:hypothetical protein [Clostridiales bacterium]
MENYVKSGTKSMFVSKCLLIAAAAVLYAMQISILIPAYGILHQLNWPDFNFKLIGILLGLALVVGIAALIFGIIGTARKEEDPNTRLTVIIKAAMIPFFCINIYLWSVLVSGMLNPFLFLAIPAIIFIGCCITYVYMIMTGMPDIIYMIAFLIRRKKKPNIYMILGLIFEFFFVLDLVGAIFIDKAYKEMQ